MSELKVSGETDNKVHFFNVKVFNLLALSNCPLTVASCYRRHEREKRISYDQRVMEIEHGTFTPLVFSAAGGMGNAATIMFRRLVSLLATKCSQPFSRTLGWIRCRLSFSLLRSAITCIRGARLTIGHPAGPIHIRVVVPCVCVCVSVRSFLPPRASRPRNIGTNVTVFSATRKKTFIIVIFAKNAWFRSYGAVICLPRTNYS